MTSYRILGGGLAIDYRVVQGRRSIHFRGPNGLSSEITLAEMLRHLSVRQIDELLREARGAAARRDEAKQRKMLESVRRAVRERDAFTCRYCGRPGVRMGRGVADPDRRSWHIDHIIPVIAGGSDELENLALACARCNLAKGARTNVRPLGLEVAL